MYVDGNFINKINSNFFINLICLDNVFFKKIIFVASPGFFFTTPLSVLQLLCKHFFFFLHSAITCLKILFRAFESLALLLNFSKKRALSSGESRICPHDYKQKNELTQFLLTRKSLNTVIKKNE